jgi:hypothetical protein
VQGCDTIISCCEDGDDVQFGRCVQNDVAFNERTFGSLGVFVNIGAVNSHHAIRPKHIRFLGAGKRPEVAPTLFTWFAQRKPLSKLHLFGERIVNVNDGEVLAGSSKFSSDLPQTNFAAYWKILVWAELCAAVRPYEKTMMSRENSNFEAVRVCIVSLLWVMTTGRLRKQQPVGLNSRGSGIHEVATREPEVEY